MFSPRDFYLEDYGALDYNVAVFVFQSLSTIVFDMMIIKANAKISITGPCLMQDFAEHAFVHVYKQFTAYLGHLL